MAEDIWDELVEKYGISGYTDKIIFVKLETLIELHEKAELWEQYAIYDNEKEAEIPVKDLIVAYERLEAVKTAFEDHRDNLIELSGNLNQIAHEPEIPEEYHYAIEKIATNMISYGELRKILEAEG